MIISQNFEKTSEKQDFFLYSNFKILENKYENSNDQDIVYAILTSGNSNFKEINPFGLKINEKSF